MDWTRYKELERLEWETKQANPITLEVTAEDYRDWKFALMLLRRVQGNTRDGDLLRVDDCLSPLLGRINDAFRALPEVRALIQEQRDMLSDDLEAKGQPRLQPLGGSEDDG